MKHTYFYCDRCGEIYDVAAGHAWVEVKPKTFLRFAYGDKYKEMDLCAKCSKQLEDWIDRPKKTETYTITFDNCMTE